MPIGYGTPRARAAVPAPAQTFPPASDQVLKQYLDAQKYYQSLGVPFQSPGLLDRFPDRAPTEMLREQVQGGLLQPVIWDRVRKGLLQTEGAPRGGSVPRVPMRGKGREFDWSYSDLSGSFTTTTPAGQWMYMRPTHSRGYEVMFDRTSSTASEGRGTTARGLERFGDVMKATKDFVKRFKPAEIEFTGDTKKHNMLYEKLAPQLAEILGGKLVKPHKNRWLIKIEE